MMISYGVGSISKKYLTMNVCRDVFFFYKIRLQNNIKTGKSYDQLS